MMLSLIPPKKLLFLILNLLRRHPLKDLMTQFPMIRENTTELSELHTNYLEIGPIIKDLKNVSPCGWRAIYIKALFGAFGAYLTKPLARLLNCIFEAKMYLAIFKIATITPIYKNKGVITDPVNFRPISILPTLSKITESVIHERLMTHLDDNKIISPAQAAYQNGDSTSQQLLYLVKKLGKLGAKIRLPMPFFLMYLLPLMQCGTKD